MDIDATIASTSTSATSTWSLLYQYSQTAFSQLFSLFNNDWIKGRASNHGIVVQTENGPVRGKTFTLLPEGRKVNAFLGIPYASAVRFKKPFPVEPWNMPLDCTKFGPRAIQYDMWWDVYLTPIEQNETKCLNICVFAPDWEQSEFKSGRPVMVFVHGGGFLIHSAANYGDWNICQNLCLHDVVVCVLQYRLGLLGFFSTGDERCPGNFGLWDLLAAFKWIKENISAFGGDPDAITAFGQSAGAAAIDLLSLSPLSKGLFKRVILMGGCASTDWAVVKPEQTQAAAIRLAKRNGWKGDDSNLDSLLQYLHNAPARKLAAPLIGKSAFNRHRKGLEFCPVIDGELIPAPVEQLRKQMDHSSLEVIIGGTEFEALLFLALGRSQSNLASLRKYLQIYIPSERLSNAVVGMRRRCEEFYLEGVDTNDPLQVSIAFLRLHSDVMINNSVQRYCQGMIGQNKHKIYLYNMIHYNRDEFGFVGLRAPFVSSTHCSDLRYLLGKGLYSKFRPNWDDKHMMHIMGTLFTNFAKYGNPNRQREASTIGNRNAIGNRYLYASWMANRKENCDDSDLDKEETNIWQPITEDDTYKYFELCLDPKMRSDYQGRRFEFWRNLELELAIMANGTVK